MQSHLPHAEHLRSRLSSRTKRKQKGLACESILAQAGILLNSNPSNNEEVERGSIVGSSGCEMEQISRV
ncbi:hypothetical protein [Rhizobium aegyptiacum]|uniref:hypothetical protein n=1 Tax=Rhizobium aegyptiacum TaxID=1764550 RepID=UPI00142DA4F6|nr:hypothetical protein [Rhizobium aegyptiacum]